MATVSADTIWIDRPVAFCNHVSRVQLGACKTSTERNYELKKILLRIHRNVPVPLRVWLPLVRHANAWRASRSTDTFASPTRFPMADSGSYRNGILLHDALCPLRSGRRRRRRRDVGHSGGVSVRRTTFDLIRSPTVDDENPLRLDRGCRDPIRDCWRNHWRDLQTCPDANDTLDLNLACGGAKLSLAREARCSGERTRLACCDWRPRQSLGGVQATGRSFARGDHSRRGRREQHARARALPGSRDDNLAIER